MALKLNFIFERTKLLTEILTLNLVWNRSYLEREKKRKKLDFYLNGNSVQNHAVKINLDLDSKDKNKNF